MPIILAEKTIITFILAVFFLYKDTCPLPTEGVGWVFVSPFIHANIFHLMANVYCLWLIRYPLRIYATIPIAMVSLTMPQLFLYEREPIMGFSGVLFAIFGWAWGNTIERERLIPLTKRMTKVCLPPIIICGLFPHVSMTIHIYCLYIAFVVAVTTKKLLLWQKGKR